MIGIYIVLKKNDDYKIFLKSLNKRLRVLVPTGSAIDYNFVFTII